MNIGTPDNRVALDDGIRVALATHSCARCGAPPPCDGHAMFFPANSKRIYMLIMCGSCLEHMEQDPMTMQRYASSAESEAMKDALGRDVPLQTLYATTRKTRRKGGRKS